MRTVSVCAWILRASNNNRTPAKNSFASMATTYSSTRKSKTGFFNHTLARENSSTQHGGGQNDATPAKPVAVAIVKSGGGFLIGSEQGNFYGKDALAIFTPMGVAKNVVNAAMSVNVARHTVVGAAEQGQAVFHGAENGVGHVLPLLGTVAEPAVIRE